MRKFLEKNIYFSFGIIFILGAVIGGFIAINRHDATISNQIRPVREKNTSYKFINPLLTYELPNSIELNEYRPLADKVRSTIKNLQKEDHNLSISVYYRDLSKGRWLGFNEDQKYTPASLMKVVLMITYLKQAESDPAILNKKIRFTKEIEGLIGVIPYDQGSTLELNKYYTTNQLLEKMVINSDNGATYALLHEMDDNTLNRVYVDLGLENPDKNGREYTVSTKDYVLFFRILYNATYLNREMSEKALDLLSRSDFKDGLKAGIDSSVNVANKYGESVITGDNNMIISVELHDCGIIYVPGKPYLLCIMTKGNNLNYLKEAIKEISRVIYNEVK